MLRLVLLCMCAAAPIWAQDQNTRLFGLSGLTSAFNQITGGGNRPNQFGNQFGGNRPNQFGNQFGGNRPNQFGNQFGGGGFNQGFNQGGFNQGGFNSGLGGGFQQQGGSQTCRRWCRTPQGQAYCCEGGNEPIQAAVTKQGQCPPVRPSCPPTRGFAPPKQCSSDGGCQRFDKCCFDTCLQHHTCKPPIGFGR